MATSGSSLKRSNVYVDRQRINILRLIYLYLVIFFRGLKMRPYLNLRRQNANTINTIQRINSTAVTKVRRRPKIMLTRNKIYA